MDALPILIGFAGPKRAGKTLAAELLMQHHGVIGMGFAQPMRVFVAELLGCTLEELELVKESPLPELGGITPRKMLQTLGTEWGRDMVHPDLWVTVAMNAADTARAGGYAVAFADVRFVNEAEHIRSRGGYIIEIQRDSAGKSGDTHVSETPLPREIVHATVHNNGTVGALYDELLSLLRGLAVGRHMAG